MKLSSSCTRPNSSPKSYPFLLFLQDFAPFVIIQIPFSSPKNKVKGRKTSLSLSSISRYGQIILPCLIQTSQKKDIYILCFHFLTSHLLIQYCIYREKFIMCSLNVWQLTHPSSPMNSSLSNPWKFPNLSLPELTLLFLIVLIISSVSTPLCLCKHPEAFFFFSYSTSCQRKIALVGIKQARKTLFKTTAIGKRYWAQLYWNGRQEDFKCWSELMDKTWSTLGGKVGQCD